jgi:hypothetical protein
MKRYYVWVWGKDGQDVKYKGTKKECKDFKKTYKGYRQEDIYITPY